MLPGCESLVKPQWTLEKEVAKKTLPPPRLAPDAVILEVTFIRVPASTNTVDSDFWNDLDETHLSAELRHRLSANGIRCGLVAGSFPDSLNTLLQSDTNTTELQGKTGDLNLNIENRNRRLQFRAGRPAQIVMSNSVKENITVITSVSDYATAERFNQAQCIFQIRTYPQGDGNVRVELIPQIHHGSPKSEFRGQDGAWLLQTQRRVKEYSLLPIDTQIAPGESLVLSATGDNKGIGRQFFVVNDDDSKTNHLLLLRLVHTQYDDLFSSATLPAN